jgi:hypothetical protein
MSFCLCYILPPQPTRTHMPQTLAREPLPPNLVRGNLNVIKHLHPRLCNVGLRRCNLYAVDDTQHQGQCSTSAGWLCGAHRRILYRVSGPCSGKHLTFTSFALLCCLSHRITAPHIRGKREGGGEEPDEMRTISRRTCCLLLAALVHRVIDYQIGMTNKGPRW